jgi:toxin-antitoxin system PIN domain toxin
VILCDVGVLLQAMIRHTAHHETCRRELERLRATPREMAVNDLILAAVVRIGTNPRLFDPCPAVEEVLAFVDALRDLPGVRSIAPGPRHWTVFKDLILGGGIRGSDTTDAYLAALAMEHGCEWWTTDGGFSRFPGLRWRNLIA